MKKKLTALLLNRTVESLMLFRNFKFTIRLVAIWSFFLSLFLALASYQLPVLLEIYDTGSPAEAQFKLNFWALSFLLSAFRAGVLTLAFQFASRFTLDISPGVWFLLLFVILSTTSIIFQILSNFESILFDSEWRNLGVRTGLIVSATLFSIAAVVCFFQKGNLHWSLFFGCYMVALLSLSVFGNLENPSSISHTRLVAMFLLIMLWIVDLNLEVSRQAIHWVGIGIELIGVT